MSGLRRVAVEDIRRIALKALYRSGLFPESATATAETIAAAERDGCRSHGGLAARRLSMSKCLVFRAVLLHCLYTHLPFPNN